MIEKNNYDWLAQHNIQADMPMPQHERYRKLLVMNGLLS